MHKYKRERLKGGVLQNSNGKGGNHRLHGGTAKGYGGQKVKPISKRSYQR